jgi:hypothetical protein
MELNLTGVNKGSQRTVDTGRSKSGHDSAQRRHSLRAARFSRDQGEHAQLSTEEAARRVLSDLEKQGLSDIGTSAERGLQKRCRDILQIRGQYGRS